MRPSEFSGICATTQTLAVSITVATCCPAPTNCPVDNTVFVTAPSTGATTRACIRSICAFSRWASADSQLRVVLALWAKPFPQLR
jgi:hypothetical protein